ncbi:DUF7144 family membrane protein [Mycobacterium sp.]|uniref:DUF7144 family membrane protein n=1 Tax=Mycobacterium sp. TaxID=1785 RepID=UPI003CC5F18D
MTEDPQSSDHRIRQTDVSRLPFMAGVVLEISGLLTLVLGLYTFSSWRGWLFIGIGIIVAATGLMLLFRVSWALVPAVVAALASLAISAIWVAEYPWFNVAAIGFDVLAIYAIAREVRLSRGRNPLRT